MLEWIDESFIIVVDVIINFSGCVIICGMGKFGIIGKKIVVFFVSIGMLSFFMYLGEVFYGDFGMVKEEDIFIVIFNLGEIEEIFKLFLFLRSNGNFVVVIIGNFFLILVRNVECYFDVIVEKEVCKF